LGNADKGLNVVGLAARFGCRAEFVPFRAAKGTC
jgi:hypothetical protein